MKRWIKYGLISAVIMLIISSIGTYLTWNYLVEGKLWAIFAIIPFIISLTCNWNGGMPDLPDCDLMAVVAPIVNILLFVILGFIIGSIIGLIVDKIKNK